MKTYLKSEQIPNCYCLVEIFPNGTYIAHYDKTVTCESVNGNIVGTYSVYESGYDYWCGNGVYDECFVEFYEKIL